MNLAALVPDNDTRIWLGRVYRELGPDWAAVLLGALWEGVLEDLGEAGVSKGVQPLSPLESEQGRLWEK